MAAHTSTTSCRIICHCLRVTDTQVRDAVETEGAQSLREVRECTGAGSGCTACHRRIKLILNECVPARCGTGDCGSLGQSASPICIAR